MNTLIKIPADTIAKLRKGVKDNYGEVAERSDVSIWYVSLILRGKRRITDKNIIVIHEAQKLMKKIECEKKKADKKGRKVAQEIENSLI